MNHVSAFLRGSVIALSAALAGAPAMAQTPVNLDFSSGNFLNWTTWTGFSTENPVVTDPVYMTLPTAGPPVGGAAPGPGSAAKSRHAITSGTAVDHYGRFPVVCPGGSGFSARIGNDVTGGEADRITYHIHVPAGSTSFNVQYQIAAVLEDPGHMINQQPSFQVIAYDSASGAVIPGANNMFIAKYLVPGFSPYVDPVTAAVDSAILWLPWTPTTANLSGMGGHTVILECTALDCSPTGHWGYGYIDVTSVADSLGAALLRYSSGGDSVVLEGPAGYARYRYWDQAFRQEIGTPSDTGRIQTLESPWNAQYYNLVITPYDRNGLADTIRTPVLAGRNVGIASAALRAAKLFPNPAGERLQLQFAAPFHGTLELYNVAGTRVWTARYDAATQAVVPVATLPTGSYSLQLKDDAGATEQRQVVVQH